MQFTTDEQHAETVAFLTEVRDYLARWPPHPMNREMLARIDAHLDQPAHRLVARAETARNGGAYTVVGQCLLQVELKGHDLLVRLPVAPSTAPDTMVLAALKEGIGIPLQLALS